MRARVRVPGRLSTVKNLDKIVVLDAGKVVEFGSHDELLLIRCPPRPPYDAGYGGGGGQGGGCRRGLLRRTCDHGAKRAGGGVWQPGTSVAHAGIVSRSICDLTVLS